MEKTKQEQKEISHAYYIKNKEHKSKLSCQYYHNNKQRWQEFSKEYYKNIRLIALKHYADSETPFCKCCGETRLEFLCIDHINNDGNIHRKSIKKGTSMYSWLKKHNYPIGFQVLCWNCNMAKSQCGLCPHQKEKGIEMQEKIKSNAGRPASRLALISHIENI